MLDFVCVIAKAIFFAFIIFGLTMLFMSNARANESPNELSNGHANSSSYDPPANGSSVGTSVGSNKKLNGIHDETNGKVFIACTNDNDVVVSHVKTNTDGGESVASSFDIESVDNSPHCKGEVK